MDGSARGWRAASATLTFVAVCVAWVFFRAANMGSAVAIVEGMFGAYGIGLPESIGNHLGVGQALLERLGVTFYLGGGSRFLETWSWVAVGGALAFLFPNTQEIMCRFDPARDSATALGAATATAAAPAPAAATAAASTAAASTATAPAAGAEPGTQAQRLLHWRPSAAWALWLGALCVASLLSLSRPAAFLYFQF